MNATFLTLAMFWMSAVAEEAPTAAAETARPEEKRSKQELPWGKPVEGVQCRLKADKSVVKYGQTPILTVDVRNQGTSDIPFDESKRHLLQLQVDGTWYKLFYAHDLSRWGIKIKSLPADQTYEGIRITCGGHWHSVSGLQTLRRFGEGGHILRVAYVASDATRVESRPVRIDVVHPMFDPFTGSDRKLIGERFSPEDVVAYHKKLTGETLPAAGRQSGRDRDPACQGGGVG